MKLDQYQRFSVAISQSVHERLMSHLLRADGQEDLCFALWHPSQGHHRFSALISDVVLPMSGERIVHGNVSFLPHYFARALSFASEHKAGLAFLHSHVGPGWQGLSAPDFVAEASHAGAVSGATDLPFLGLTLGTDEAWSARYWKRAAPREYVPLWCERVRVVGDPLRLTYHPTLCPTPEAREELLRTIGVWGIKGQADLARLHVCIVGLGSVGSLVCDALARMGFQEVTLIDYDTIKILNLDRTHGATRKDIGRLKIDVAADQAFENATASSITLNRYGSSLVEEFGYYAALDCDVIFSCVDRHWPRRVLNHIAYAHLIPVIDGGILVRTSRHGLIGADWQVHTVGPGRRCLECLKAFDPSTVGLEREGLLDDPSYVLQLDRNHEFLRHENVYPFSMNLASLEILQLAAMVVGPISNLGNQNYHYSTGNLDRTANEGCREGCLYPPLLATGELKYAVSRN